MLLTTPKEPFVIISKNKSFTFIAHIRSPAIIIIDSREDSVSLPPYSIVKRAHERTSTVSFAGRCTQVVHMLSTQNIRFVDEFETSILTRNLAYASVFQYAQFEFFRESPGNAITEVFVSFVISVSLT